MAVSTMYKVFAISLFVMCHGNSVYKTNNVCKTFNDYATMTTNPNCYYNPDVDAPPALIVKRYGYPFEKYKVQSEDGYISGLYRIPHNNIDTEKVRQPILLQHGISITSAAWMLMGKRSLAFYLSDQGYDVWLSNGRGSQFSTGHVNLTINDPAYWNFSFHEMAIYDLPTIIDFIANATGQQGKIIYVGHSMGTTMSYIYASLMPEHAKKNLRGIISLAPIAYLAHVRSFAKFLVPYADSVGKLLKSLGLHAIGQFPRLQRQLVHNTCNMFPLILPCEIVNFIFTGISSEQVSPEMVPIFFGHYPSGTSVKTFLHFSQLIRTHQFRFFDYGSENMGTYNISKAPEYPIEKINVPVHLFAGKNDFLSDTRKILNNFGIHAIAYPAFQRDLLHHICNMFPLPCEIVNSALSGISVDQVSPNVIPIFFGHYPDGTSLKTINHFAQLIVSNGKFQYYDYGTDMNVDKYNSSTPPEYPVHNIDVPVYLFGGNNDFLSELVDIDILYDKLQTKKSVYIATENGSCEFSHNDFLMGQKTTIFQKDLFETVKNNLP